MASSSFSQTSYSSRPRNTYCIIPWTPAHEETDSQLERTAQIVVDANANENERSQAFVAALLARRMGGRRHDFQIAGGPVGNYIVIFPSVTSMHIAIRCSPIRTNTFAMTVSPLDGNSGTITQTLQYYVWIRLLNYPIYCHQYAEAETIVSSFGRYIGADDPSRHYENFRYYRVLIKCIDPNMIPEQVTLYVDNREWIIRVVIESWERCEPTDSPWR